MFLALALGQVEDGRGFGPCAATASSWAGRTPSIVTLEFAGSTKRADQMLACWDDAQRRDLRDVVDADTWLIAAYVANFSLWCAYGARHLYRAALRRLGVLTTEACTDPALAQAWAAAATYQDFPNDSTVDQWLTDEQFDGYVALGRHVAARARARLAELVLSVEKDQVAYASIGGQAQTRFRSP